MRLFSFYPQAGDLGERQGLIPATVHVLWRIFCTSEDYEHDFCANIEVISNNSRVLAMTMESQ
jgi:hypothetical protein